MSSSIDRRSSNDLSDPRSSTRQCLERDPWKSSIYGSSEVMEVEIKKEVEVSKEMTLKEEVRTKEVEEEGRSQNLGSRGKEGL